MAEAHGPFCHMCGERRLTARDQSLHHYLQGLVAATLNLEGKLWRTLRALIGKPGLLTAEYWRGRRVPYMHPLSLFLVVNLAYFLLAQAQGLAAVPFSYIAQKPLHLALIEQKLDVTKADRPGFRRAMKSYTQNHRANPQAEPIGRKLQAYAQRYDATAPVLSRSLILMMIAMFAPFPILLELRRRRRYPVVAHLVFATHVVTVFMLIFLVTEWFWRLVMALGRLLSNSTVPVGNNFLTLLPMLLCLGAYLYFSIRRFYENTRVAAVAKACLLLIGMVLTVLGYQRLLFFVTLAAT